MRTLLSYILIVVVCASVHAQDKKEKKEEDKNVLELPEFVITGQGSLGIQSVRKQDVSDDWKLDSATRALLHPVVGTARTAGALDSVSLSRPLILFPLVAHAQFGMYRTPEGWLHYSGASAPFDWAMRAEGAATQGSVDHAVASGAALNGRAGWRMPDNIVAFGNARVELDFGVANRMYNLYGSPTPTLERGVNARHLQLGLNQDLGTTPFALSFISGSAGVNDSLDQTDKYFGIDASAAIIAPHWTVSGRAHVRGYTTAATQRNFTEMDFDAQYTVAPFRYSFGVGLFTARNTMFESSTQLAPHAAASLTLGGVELFASVARRMRDESIATIIAANSFVNLAALDSIRYPLDEIDLRFGVRTADVRMLAAEAHLAYVRTSSEAVFVPNGAGRWTIAYMRTATLEAAAETRWRAAARTSIVVGGAVRSTMLEGGSVPVPFVPAADGSATVNQSFEIPLEVSATITVSGRRTGAPDGSISIPAVPLLNMDASYALSQHIALTLQARNLLDTKYEIWHGYQGTRIFAALGVTARL